MSTFFMLPVTLLFETECFVSQENIILSAIAVWTGFWDLGVVHQFQSDFSRHISSFDLLTFSTSLPNFQFYQW